MKNKENIAIIVALLLCLGIISFMFWQFSEMMEDYYCSNIPITDAYDIPQCRKYFNLDK